MSIETAARLQNLDLMARQISTQISGARRAAVLPGASGQPPVPSVDRGSRKAEENALALRRGLEQAEILAKRPSRLPIPSPSRVSSGDRAPRKDDGAKVALKRNLDEVEDLLRTRTEALYGERLRPPGDEQRAQSLLVRTRNLLKETREQLAAAQKRAEEAEEYLAALHDILRINLDFGRTSVAALTRR